MRIARRIVLGRQRAVAVATVLNAAGIPAKVRKMVVPAYDMGEFHFWSVEPLDQGRVIDVESREIGTLKALKPKNPGTNL